MCDIQQFYGPSFQEWLHENLVFNLIAFWDNRELLCLSYEEYLNESRFIILYNLTALNLRNSGMDAFSFLFKTWHYIRDNLKTT